MAKIKLLVDLKIPDSIAITAFNTLKKMGFELEKLERNDYYEFLYLRDEKEFAKKIKEVDILVNANKHIPKVLMEGEKEEGEFVSVVVMDRGDNSASVLETLRERLGFHDIAEMKKGNLWKFYGVTKEKAEEMTKSLLYNEHYQEYFLI